MDVLTKNQILSVFHYAPLHYLPFIGRSQRLLGKQALAEAGFPEVHCRSSSAKQDIRRGFANYVHLALDAHPPILGSKLSAGFPHFELKIPTSAVEQAGFHLCRFNIAKTRYFRGASREPSECAENGRYYDGMLIPIAQTQKERLVLFDANYGKNMIEVLVPGRLDLPGTTVITVFDPEDERIANAVFRTLGLKWQIERANYQGHYTRRVQYVKQVSEFIERALADTDWKGNGLDFDRV